MCAYAREVLTGQLPGPYTDHNARRFARAALVPDELADPDRIAHTHRNQQQTARALKLPAAELGVRGVQAGQTGYRLTRASHAAGVGCVVAAPGKIKRPPAGDNVKTDQRDAERVLRC